MRRHRETRLKTCSCALPGLWHRKGEREDAECVGHQYLFPSWPEDGVVVIAVLRDSLAAFPRGFTGSGLHIYIQVLSGCFIKFNSFWEEGVKLTVSAVTQARRKKKHEHREVCL